MHFPESLPASCAGVRRGGVPAALNRFPRQSLVQARQTYQCVHHAAQRGGLSEPHAENGGYEIKVKRPDKAPVQRADYHQPGCDYIKFLHIVSSPSGWFFQPGML
jgi:hypothetical protein